MSESHDSAPPPAPAPPAEPAAPSPPPTGVWERLKEHKVMQWTLAYAAAAYTLLHVVEMLSDAQDWPHAIVRLFSLLLIVGVPVVMTLAWYHGARAQRHVSGSELTIITLLLFIGGTALWALSRNRGEATHGAAPRAAEPLAVAASDKSIAVLPFADMSEAKDQEYFADGMAEEILDLLSRIPALKVIARTSSFQFKGQAADVRNVARLLGVATVLEGSVRKAGNRLRITTQLIRAADGSHLWSESYDRNVDDVFRVQDEIAGAVVQRLELSLLDPATLDGSPTGNPEAHSLYLQARYLVNGDTLEGLNRAVALYQQAIALDPKFAAAYAGLAYCHGRRIANGNNTAEAFASTRDAAEHAIALDPRLPDGYVMLAMARMQYDRDWSAAAQNLDKARALDPNNVPMLHLSGHLSSATGTLEEAIGDFRRAVERDPLNPLLRRYLARMLYYAGQYDEAAQLLRGVIASDPEFPAAHYELGRVLLATGDRQAAMAAFAAEPSVAWHYFGMPLGLHALNRTTDASKALAALVANSSGSEFQVAETYAYFGDIDQAFQWLGRARDLRDPGIIVVRRDPMLRPLERDPRYPTFLASVGLKAP